jgi:monoamine oxidase
MDSTDFGESIRQISAYAAATEYFESNPTDEMDYKIDGGNARLIDALVNSLPKDSVHRSCEVTEVHQRRGKVIVFASGSPQPFVGDACICTVPARWLNRIKWKPALPVAQRAAADQLQYARITKTAVYYPEKFWRRPARGGFSVFTSEVSDFCFESTYRQHGSGGILCSYAIGDKADDIAEEPPQDLKRWITQDIMAADSGRSPSKGTVDRYLRGAQIQRQPWQASRYSQGAYALYRPGLWFTVRKLLSRPHGRVLFAGEHLADWQGFMEGAVETGEAAAGQL